MPLSPDNFLASAERFESFSVSLQKCFDRMDRAYGKIAAAYGFHCSGCDDSCCLTRFHHHTWLEFFFLYQGFKSQARQRQTEIRARAHLYQRALTRTETPGHVFRSMCPLNFDGLCCLYDYRPMICRLHGLPHELGRPGRGIVRSSGCDNFHLACGRKDYIPFDRTPHYVEMAALEGDFRRTADLQSRIKMTVAEMILQFQV